MDLAKRFGDETMLSVMIIEMLCYSPWICGFDFVSIFKCKFKRDVILQNNLLTACNGSQIKEFYHW